MQRRIENTTHQHPVELVHLPSLPRSLKLLREPAFQPVLLLLDPVHLGDLGPGPIVDTDVPPLRIVLDAGRGFPPGFLRRGFGGIVLRGPGSALVGGDGSRRRSGRHC